jgi:hypothetical protein
MSSKLSGVPYVHILIGLVQKVVVKELRLATGFVTKEYEEIMEGKGTCRLHRMKQ